MSDTLMTNPLRSMVDRLNQLERENAKLLKDKERLDWLDQNMMARDAVATFGYEIEIGKLRAAIDAARKEAKP